MFEFIVKYLHILNQILIIMLLFIHFVILFAQINFINFNSKFKIMKNLIVFFVNFISNLKFTINSINSNYLNLKLNFHLH